MVVNSCLRYLWALGCYVWRQNTGAYKPEGSHRFIRYGTPGCADIIGVTPGGRFIACECKYGKNSQRDTQKRFQEYVEEHNGIYVLAKSIEDIEARKGEILA